MQTQEIKILAQIPLEVPIELSKEELVGKFSGALISISVFENSNYRPYISTLEIVNIEEEAEIYGTESDS